MSERARVTYLGDDRVQLHGSTEARPVGEIGPGDTVEVTAAAAERLLERDDFEAAGDDADLAELSGDTPPAPEPIPLDIRREAVADALEPVDGDVTRLRGASLDDALRAAYGDDVEIPRTLAERQALLAALTPAPDDEDA